LLCGGSGSAQDNEVVGISHDAKAKKYQPLIQDVQDNIRQEGRDDPALRSALGGRENSPVLHEPSREKLSDEAEDVAIGNPFGNQVDDDLSVEVVVAGLDIAVGDDAETGIEAGQNGFNRLVGVTTWSEAVRAVSECGFENRLDEATNDLLSDSIPHGGNAQWAQFSVSLRDVDTTYGRRLVGTAVFEVVHKGEQVLFEVGLEHRNCDAIYPRDPAILLDLLESPDHQVSINTPRKRVDLQRDGFQGRPFMWPVGQRHDPMRT
jgi:hypothetical protein